MRFDARPAPVLPVHRPPPQNPGLARRLGRLGKKRQANERTTIALEELRGTRGSAHEGYLDEVVDSCIACWSGARRGYFAVKGPWILRFRNDRGDARSMGLPIPLDGAKVQELGKVGLRLVNTHVKDDFCGKAMLEIYEPSAIRSFTHSICLELFATTAEVRDQWLQTLRGQVEKLAQRASGKTDMAYRKTNSNISEISAFSADSAAVVDSYAAALFALWEKEEELEYLSGLRPAGTRALM